ncbi:MAG TPA: TraB/GumN family protein [Candidatus Poseidoniaceae archaeon]|nr:conjugal transfer protein TraB [Euryarchaeota archaeon]DAC53073.1 MAG TPA: TraB/GumN family protein [Candidatus Poseidoniales archaeon]DAC69611.1 MAG TPA: TraB/GumN family protein [Candidatus Poseidoniales archaeon]HII31443.1 TraB/GumN family protein [Candidatus Poseidoniaceae archaeon]|tara:strand:- start:2101 stop:3270 length:1170 start_codon:yes stop_codon:yes gene_type:complete
MSASSPYIDISPTLRLLGTAHVATTSVEAVKEQIETYQPKIVGVELCKTRHDALVEGRRLDKEGLRRVIKEGKAPMVLMQAMLSAEQRRLGLNEGQEPGAELLAAVETAKAAGIEVALVDRDIQVTMRRAWKKMKWRERFRLLFSLFGDDEELEEDFDLDELLTDSDLLSTMMEDLKEFSQGAGEALIDERDRYIAEKIMQSKTEEKMLVVVGAGHLKGIERALNPYNPLSTEELESISTVPKKGIIGKVLPFAIPLIVMGLVGFALFNNNEVDYVKMLTVWTLFNAIFAAIGCILARGHPLAILTAALASPITSLNPALAAGWFAGYVQLRISEPTTEDLQQFLKGTSIGGFWSNRAGRVLLVTALTNLGSMLGAWFAAAGFIGGGIT